MVFKIYIRLFICFLEFDTKLVKIYDLNIKNETYNVKKINHEVDKYQNSYIYTNLKEAMSLFFYVNSALE
ncbi:hypothetical protein [Campylobacter ureolyticus]|uniref:hypothetical protein n=1 Tax=Campylobacter ureolyticus TaxID=827 RepID=UPI0022B2DC36|nr:hypothetical protein [Campylobacter ureolyticus]MCZ6174563.1 hypothetical protein [Campylobacter ureolyticus]